MKYFFVTLSQRFIYRLLLILWWLGNASAWAIDLAGFTNRPSATPLPQPELKSAPSTEHFDLPPLNEAQIPQLVQRTLAIRHIHLEGNAVLTDADLRPLLLPYEGRDASVVELENLRQSLTRYYVDRGYINSGAVIAADAYHDGELTIRIIEGHIEEVRVKGTERLREGYVANRLIESTEQPFNLQTLQGNYQVLLSDPLISRINGRILPGSSPGSSILDLDVTRAQPYHLTVFGNNQRPPSIGAEAFGVNGQLRNLTGLGDALDFTYITSTGSNRFAGGFSLPVTDAGTQAFFHFDEGDTMVYERSLKSLSITSQVHSLESGLSHTLIHTPNQWLSIGALFAIRENETFLLGKPYSFVPGEPTGHNQATVWRLFQDFSQRWEQHTLVFHSSFSVGMNALGATPHRAVPPQLATQVNQYPSSEFFAWLGQIQYAWRFMDNGSQWLVKANAQFSDSPLLPLERIAIGGFYTVRGYRENELVRDNGYNVSSELRLPLLGGNQLNARHSLSLVPFLDYGEAWYFGQPGVALFSVGAGLEWQFKPVSAQIYYGHALNARPSPTTGDLQDSGIHFNARWDIL